MENARIGEVVEASTAAFTAQCYRLGEPPPLGSLVTTADGDIQIYGVVCYAATGSFDPGRHVAALGREEATEEELHRSHPELGQLLRTDFQSLILGHRVGETMRSYLPPRPPRIHAFVHLASQEELRAFTATLRFLHALANAPAPTRDDALAACLRLASRAHPDAEAFLVRAGKELATLLARDTPRLNAVLRMLLV